ncbi:MAG: alpha/beta hydrolase [Pseudomonadota bacterium]|nr:alpha/beta hydrolase [Pseudomonadota bacterium]
MSASDTATGASPNILHRPGGRRLAWTENGAHDGRPVVVLHGTPGCRLSRYGDDENLRKAGIRQISYERPGYGYSDPQPGRSVKDAVADIEVILDAAGVERAGFIGNSGGGPHALAVATLLASRATLVHCNVGVAPRLLLGDEGFFEGMDPENIRRFRAADLPREQTHAALTSDLDRMVAAARVDPMTIAGDMKMPEADAAVMRLTAASYAANFIEALRPGYWGFIDDFSAMARDWGFDPREAEAPVIIEYGFHDVNVPEGHGRWLAENIPGATVIVNAEGGHRSLPQKFLERLKTLAQAK